MKTIPLEEALKQVIAGPRLIGRADALNCITNQAGITTAICLLVYNERPYEEIISSAKSEAALLAHFYNHGPELVSVLAEVTEVLDMVFPFGHPREGSIAKRANDLIAKVSTVQLP